MSGNRAELMFVFDREEMINKQRIIRLAGWHNGKEAGPVQVDVELHKRCNLKCVFCSRYTCHERLNKESENNEMPVKRWLEIIDEAAELGALVFNIEGINEPPAVPDLFFPVVKKVKEAGMYGIVTTNGTLWKEEELRDLVKIGWDRIHFSIHSSTSRTHDQLSGMKGAFDRVIRSVEILNKWKRKFGSQRPMLNINTCVNRLNYDKLPEMVEFAHELEANYIFTEPLMVFSDDGGKLKLDAKDRDRLPAFINRAKNLAEKYGIDNNFATQDKNLDEEIVKKTSDMGSLLLKDVEGLDNGLIAAPCFKAWDRIAIRYNGLTGHCGFVEDGEDARKKSLKEIWHGKFFQNARERTINKNLFTHCSKCVPSDLTQRRRFRKELMEAVKGEDA